MFSFFRVWLEVRRGSKPGPREQGGGREEESVNTAPKSPRRQQKMLGNQTETETGIPKKKEVKSEGREVGGGPFAAAWVSRLAWQFSRWLDCNFQLDLGLQPRLTRM